MPESDAASTTSSESTESTESLESSYSKSSYKRFHFSPIDSGDIVRYDDKLYYIRSQYSLYYFHECYSYILTPSNYGYEFTLDFEKKEYDDHKSHTKEFNKSMFRKITKEMKRLPRGCTDAERDKEFLDCLQKRYVAGTTITIRKEEVEEREQYHKSQFQKAILEFYGKIANSIYKHTKDGFKGFQTNFVFSENDMTSYKKYPIFYSVPSADGIQRKTYQEYLYYIMFKEFPKDSEYDGTLTEQDWFGIVICRKLKKVYGVLDIQYISGSAAFPTFEIRCPIKSRQILT